MRPLREVFVALREAGVIGPVVAGCAVAIAALGVVFEALLLRSVLDGLGPPAYVAYTFVPPT